MFAAARIITGNTARVLLLLEGLYIVTFITIIIIVVIVIIVVVVVDLMTLLNMYLLENLLSQTIGGISLPGEGNSSHPLRSRGLS
jgi:hypothetical protein